MHAILIALLVAAVSQTPPSPLDIDPFALVHSGALAEYVYPGATTDGVAATSDLNRMVMTTPASPEDVLGFYESLLGEPLRATCIHGRTDGWIASCNDSRVPITGAATTQPLALHILSKKSGAELLTVVISRTPDESLTHIVILLVTSA